MKIPGQDEIEQLDPDDLELEPLDDYLFILVDPKHEKAGEIWLSQKQKQPTRVGTVIALGPKVTPGKFKIGDKVLMDAWNGYWLTLPKYKIMGGTHKVVPEREIWGRIKE